jgi:F0F1-type ATP synthase membrane subunit a
MMQSRETQMLSDVHDAMFRPETGVKDKLSDLHHHHSHTRERLEKMEKYIDETVKGRKHLALTILVAIMSSAVAVGVAISNRQVNEQKMQSMVEAVTRSVLTTVNHDMDAGSAAP